MRRQDALAHAALRIRAANPRSTAMPLPREAGGGRSQRRGPPPVRSSPRRASTSSSADRIDVRELQAPVVPAGARRRSRSRRRSPVTPSDTVHPHHRRGACASARSAQGDPRDVDAMVTLDRGLVHLDPPRRGLRRPAPRIDRRGRAPHARVAHYRQHAREVDANRLTSAVTSLKDVRTGRWAPPCA